MGDMAYVALYRTWRPQDFDDLVGQEPIKKALTNALETGRISHAYLFAGPRGTGKTSTARILAKALNCEKGPTAHPCNQCTNCREITEGTSSDVVEIDAASNRGIDEIRKLREQVYFAPVSSRYKVYIIDEVHMITTDAFNALLKTLEEPPDHVVFILATTEPQKILNTILSRCQRFDFHRATVDEIARHLARVAAGSHIEATPQALRLMAIQADGGLRDALSLLDQCSVMASPVTEETVRQVLGLVGRGKVAPADHPDRPAGPFRGSGFPEPVAGTGQGDGTDPGGADGILPGPAAVPGGPGVSGNLSDRYPGSPGAGGRPFYPGPDRGPCGTDP
jgi:DNA polymerase III subunit gamma/tau